MLNCKQATLLVSQALDKKLSTREQFSLKMHLFICKYCKRFSQQLHKLHDAINSMGKSIESDESIILSPKAKKRIVKSMGSTIEDDKDITLSPKSKKTYR